MNKVFFYEGHGYDKCDAKGELIIKTVPDNCIYMTITSCGLHSNYDYHQLRFITDPDLLLLFLHPTKPKYRKAIAPLLGVKEEDIHIHLPGDTYVDAGFLPISYWKKPNGIEMSLSGIISNDDVGNIKDKRIFDTTLYKKDIPIEEFLTYFPGKLPSAEIIRKKIPTSSLRIGTIDLTDLNILSNNLERSVSEIMSKRPGIHYNLVCRSAPNCKPESISVRRAVSIAKQREYKEKPQLPVVSLELIDAINKKDIPAIKSLLLSGINPLIEDSSGKSALDYAKEIRGRTDIYQLLLTSLRKGGCQTRRHKTFRKSTRRRRQ